MGDETESGSAQTAAGNRIQAMGLKGDGFAVLFGTLAKNPVIMRRTGGFQLKLRILPLIIKPVEGFFIFLGIDGCISNIFSPTGRHQQENMMGDSSKFYSKFLNPGYFT